MNIKSLPYALCLLVCLCFSTTAYAEPSSPSTYSLHNALVDAADRGDISEVKNLIHSGTPIDGRGDLGTTALMRAALKGYTDVASLLIDGGADTDAVDLGGATALHLAVRQGNEDIVKLLLKADTMVDTPDNEGWTPLMRAALGNKATLAPLLISKGANLTKTNNLGDNAFTLAIKANSASTLTILVKNPAFAKLSAAEKSKLTRLASEKKNPDITALLSPKPVMPKPVAAPAAPAKKTFFGFLGLTKTSKTTEAAKPLSAPPAVIEEEALIAKADAPAPVSSLPLPTPIPLKKSTPAPVRAPARTAMPAPKLATTAPTPAHRAAEQALLPPVAPAAVMPAPVYTAPAQPNTRRIPVGEAIRVPLSNQSQQQIRPATRYLPSSSKSLKKTLWVQAGPYTSNDVALAAYDNVSGNSAASGLRVRVISGLKQDEDAGVSLRLGPISPEDAEQLCTLLREGTEGISCGIVEDFGKSAVISATPGGYSNYVHPANRANPVLTHTGKYWLQFGTFASEGEALTMRDSLKTTNADLARSLTFAVFAPQAGSNNQAAYRLRGGTFPTYEAASTLCNAFTNRAVRCIVIQ